MRVVVTSARRFLQTPDGKVWTPSTDDYSFWQRYLEVFDDVSVLGRVYLVEKADPNWKLVTGSKVTVESIPQYSGPTGYIKALIPILRHVRKIVRPIDAVILRMPSPLSVAVALLLWLRRQPYGAEVIGDTDATLSAESIEHPLRPFLRIMSVQITRQLCRNACSIAYVTESALQQKYPPALRAFATHYSSIELPDEHVATQPKIFNSWPMKIISVGSMSMKYKRFDILIEAVKRNIAAGLDLKLILIGDGGHRRFFEDCAIGIEDRVKFMGELPGSEYVREQLRDADLFVLASANEGLPRVIIEAMAAGLPCLGTTVGGTSELLPVEDLVAPGNVEALTNKLQEIINNPVRMNAMAARNMETARRYSRHQLARRRRRMYQYLRDVTERWITAGLPPRGAIVESCGNYQDTLQIKVKYTLDRILAPILLIALAPLFLIIAIVIKLEDYGPIFYRQERIGWRGKPFTIWKFRTMVVDADRLLNPDGTVSTTKRITRIGKLLRFLSLDELPQLINIIDGKMSFIGPRPVLIGHVLRYTDEQKIRLCMKPGVTGLAQINGRNTLTWSKRIEYDIQYVRTYSLWIDIQILLYTVKTVIAREGIVLDRNPEQVDDLGGN
jgi:lipopolysaccharide/colanic/teichoic acid biosynthesis glycosyltransferase/glycosyltransferase involved in cell wall biosynthesis